MPREGLDDQHISLYCCCIFQYMPTFETANKFGYHMQDDDENKGEDDRQITNQ
jgi:hypothetical protein